MSKEKDSKLKALQLTLDKLDKTYGKGTVMKMGDAEIVEIDSISSGSLTLDNALGVGGYPKGRVIEIYGPESSGKTTLTLHAIAECQKAGGIAAFIDAEHAFDRFYAQNLGINIDELIISQPDNGEQGLEIADNLIRSGAIDIIVIDSVAALTPRSEIEGEMGDSKMGLHARLMSQALRKLTSHISKTNCTVIFINQLREKIGVMFGNPETTTGGNALKFYASVRLDIRRSTQIKDTSGNVSNDIFKLKLNKNEVGSSTMPHKVNPIDFENAEGNFGISSALFEFFANKLTKSRHQRDLSDSTVLRNIGLGFGYSSLALSSTNKGLSKITPNILSIKNELDNNWEVLTEAVQTPIFLTNHYVLVRTHTDAYINGMKSNENQ